jgi:HlyD family secretion protein
MRKSVPISIVLLGTALLAGQEVREREHAAGRHLPPPYQLAEVGRGRAITKVLAAGTVQPAVNVVVGSEVSGRVKEVLVDHNDVVHQGQLLARIDPDLYTTRVEQAKAEVEVATEAARIAKVEVEAAEAAVITAIALRAKAEAQSKRDEVAVEHTARQLQRKATLNKGGWSSESDTDDARAAHDLAVSEAGTAAAEVASQDAKVAELKAQLAVVRSRVAKSEAEVQRSRAALRQAEADLDRTMIRSPVDGVVIERNVEAGQTVVASLEAPKLFTVGKLDTVNVEIAVDEADVGSLRDGQSASFSVDAYPNQSFSGRIVQIRKAPHVKESVVTYTVVAAADNPKLLLYPGMTATANIVTRDVPDALQVPTAALRYQPQGSPGPSGSQVWLAEGESIRLVPVQVGSSNDGMSEIVAGALSEGDRVVVGDAQENTAVSTELGSLVKSVSAAIAGSVVR